MADPIGVLQANANVGGSGSGNEQGFDSAYLALQPAMLSVGGVNAGFLRDHAMLQIISWTDEAEQSTFVSNGDPAAYVAFFQSLKSEPYDAVLSDISGGSFGCSGVGAAGPGVDLVAATELSGGVSVLICDADYLPAFAGYAWRTDAPDDTFELSELPMPGTLEVSVEGVPVTGWTHSLWEVEFAAGANPADGEIVEIAYAAVPTCE